MTTAIAATVGVGNVAGVATAIVSGGPGAVFWMWVSAFFGMMTKYSEILLAVKFRIRDENGVYHGGPMYYIDKGLKSKWLSSLFCIFGAMACFGIGNMNQSNEIAAAMKKTLNLSPLITGFVTASLVALVIIGGISRIGRVTEVIVPFMALFYIVGGLIALVVNRAHIPGAFEEIFTEAFSARSIGGGVMGYTVVRAMRYGFARGVFSNEAGLGSAPIAHSVADTNNPVRQGFWGIFEVFIDTIVICTITSLVVITSGLAGVHRDVAGKIVSGGALTSAAYEAVFGPLGGTFVSVAIIFFAGSTILAWSYYGQQCISYLTDESETAQLVFKVIFICFIVIGALGRLSVIWDISDTLNGMMAIPNLIGVLGLSGVVFKMTRDYMKNPSSVQLKE
jgi:AGCS family alanine or glycine:cation symporter